MSVVHVAVAVIYNRQGEVLIQQRAQDAHQGGLWEFPGGKLEARETVLQALEREIYEELGIRVQSSRPLIKISHDYGDRVVLLDVHRVHAWHGELQALENQPMQWVSPDRLENHAMPAADKPIITALRLSSSYVITPPQINDVEALLQQFERLLSQGEGLFLYRVKTLQGFQHEHLIEAMLKLCEPYSAQFLVHEKNAVSLDARILAGGIHLTEDGLRQAGSGFSAPGLLSVSCHSLESLRMAQDIGADFAMLSPVEATGSHPGVKPLGWQAFAEIVSQVSMPVFALGGMTPAKVEQAWSCGAQGVAGISSWWV